MRRYSLTWTAVRGGWRHFTRALTAATSARLGGKFSWTWILIIRLECVFLRFWDIETSEDFYNLAKSPYLVVISFFDRSDPPLYLLLLPIWIKHKDRGRKPQSDGLDISFSKTCGNRKINWVTAPEYTSISIWMICNRPFYSFIKI